MCVYTHRGQRRMSAFNNVLLYDPLPYYLDTGSLPESRTRLAKALRSSCWFLSWHCSHSNHVWIFTQVMRILSSVPHTCITSTPALCTTSPACHPHFSSRKFLGLQYRPSSENAYCSSRGPKFESAHTVASSHLQLSSIKSDIQQLLQERGTYAYTQTHTHLHIR